MGVPKSRMLSRLEFEKESCPLLCRQVVKLKSLFPGTVSSNCRVGWEYNSEGIQ